MLAPGGRPLPQDRWEVADVVVDQDALFGGRQRKDLVILQPFEISFLIEGANVMPARFEPAPDCWSSYVSIKQQAHPRRLLPGLEKRVERA